MRAFIVNRLWPNRSTWASEHFTALSETAERFNETRWFWTDDNAKAAELLAEPAFYDCQPGPRRRRHRLRHAHVQPAP